MYEILKNSIWRFFLKNRLWGFFFLITSRNSSIVMAFDDFLKGFWSSPPTNLSRFRPLLWLYKGHIFIPWQLWVFRLNQILRGQHYNEDSEGKEFSLLHLTCSIASYSRRLVRGKQLHTNNVLPRTVVQIVQEHLYWVLYCQDPSKMGLQC